MIRTAVLALAIALIGCSKGGNGDNGARAFDVNPQGFKATAPTSNTVTNERYARGCKTPGQPSGSTGDIDPMLQIGQVFAMKLQMADIKKYITFAGTQTVTAKTATSIQTVYNVSDSNLPIPRTITQNCNKSANQTGGFDWQCAMAELSNFNPGLEQCSIDNGFDAPTYEETAGTYLDRKAYLISWTAHGKISCNGVDKGHGTMTSQEIRTNQVPALDLEYCGGVSVFTSFQIKTDGGQVLTSMRQETTSAPLVNQ